MSQLREQLEAAMAGQSVEPVEPVTTAAEGGEAAAPAAAEPSEIQAESQAPQTGAERDEQGRFKPKTTTAEAGAEQTATPAQPKIETAKPAETEPQSEAIRIPPSLPAAVKAQWSDLKPEVQQAFHKLEESVQTAKAEWGKKGERLNRYDEIIGPHVDRWRVGGLDEFSGIQALISAQNILERNPVEGLVHIARSYGVNLHALAQQAISQQPGQEGYQAPTAVPGLETVLQPLVQQVQTLQQQLQAQSQASEAAQLAEARSAVEQFRNDPANLYFDNVKDDVARRLESGAAKTLADAYEQAIWASPDIRPLLLKAQTAPAPVAVDAAKRAADEAARTKAAKASQAAGSVTGAPAPGAQAPRAPVGSVRDSLMAAMQEHSA